MWADYLGLLLVGGFHISKGFLKLADQSLLALRLLSPGKVKIVTFFFPPLNGKISVAFLISDYYRLQLSLALKIVC